MHTFRNGWNFMKDYGQYTAEDFLQDDDFVQWVAYPNTDPDRDAFWEEWLRSNPHKIDEVEEARLLVLSIVTEKQYQLQADDEQKLWRRIEGSLTRSRFRNRNIPRSGMYYAYRVAAAVLLLVLSVSGYYALQNSAPFAEIVYRSDAPDERSPEGMKTVFLPDSTKVVLQPGSELEVSNDYGLSRREVHITGEAFFSVVRNPNKPFIVYSNDIVTKVLGTSFTVRSYSDEQSVIVSVKTGKVSVYKESKSFFKGYEGEEALVLTPNQEAVYSRADRNLSRKLAEDPQVLVPMAEAEFNFVKKSLSDVFRLIEDTYGVDVVFDEELMKNCYLNASLSELSLYEKIRVICKAVNASYEIIDTHIVIYGNGCNPS